MYCGDSVWIFFWYMVKACEYRLDHVIRVLIHLILASLILYLLKAVTDVCVSVYPHVYNFFCISFLISFLTHMFCIHSFPADTLKFNVPDSGYKHTHTYTAHCALHLHKNFPL